MKTEIKLGDTAICKVTGFTGVVTGRAEYMSGRVNYLLSAKSVDNKEAVESWVEEAYVEADLTADAII